MIRLNVEALTHLTHALVPGMIRRGGGAVVNVSSLACLLPIPDFAVYAATKAYVTSFSEALRIELRGHGIPVLAVCPGPVHTGFGEVARRDEHRPEHARPGMFLRARGTGGRGITGRLGREPRPRLSRSQDRRRRAGDLAVYPSSHYVW